MDSLNGDSRGSMSAAPSSQDAKCATSAAREDAPEADSDTAPTESSGMAVQGRGAKRQRGTIGPKIKYVDIHWTPESLAFWEREIKLEKELKEQEKRREAAAAQEAQARRAREVLLGGRVIKKLRKRVDSARQRAIQERKEALLAAQRATPLKNLLSWSRLESDVYRGKARQEMDMAEEDMYGERPERLR